MRTVRNAGFDMYTKSALRTVRIPLSVYAIKCLGVDAVDLTNIVSLTFEFDEKPTGEIEILWTRSSEDLAPAVERARAA